MSAPIPSPIVACWSCQEPVSPSAAQCMWCGAARPGVAHGTGAIPSALPPGMGGTHADQASPPVQQAQQQNTALPGLATQPAGMASAPAMSSATAATYSPRQADSAPALGAAFRGRAAGTGARLAAFTLDVFATLAIAGAVLAATGSPVLAAVAVLECVVFLWVLEARTGLSVGNAIMGIRTSRKDAPFSPGVGRSAGRFAFTGAGFVVGLVGAWIVVASSAWDGQSRRRGWADMATGTMTVASPRAARSGRLPGVNELAAYQAPHVERAAQQVTAPTTTAPSNIERPLQVPLEYEDSHSSSRTVAPSDTALPAITPTIPAPTPAPNPTGTSDGPPAPAEDSALLQASAASAEASHGDVLLVFDTGQREQVPLPAGIVLGRNPSPIEPSDHTIVVTDTEKTVSRTHVRIEHSRGRTWVTDNGSANGTDLIDHTGGATPLVAHERTLLEDGMRVRIGQRAFSINILTDGPQGGRA
ncbi:FHA domain-containing protein [Demequina aurantiaca]|uniref:FHA domain-containing protein n=1 Tax=Demequina aurantiaca TaxID=676200 RepID=UPI003D359325